MTAPQNVGVLDSRIRILLGIACVGALGYHFLVARILPLYALIPVVIGVPFFLKTGITRVCPIMKAVGISTNGEPGARPDGSA
jgi:hypothetical protein